MTHSFSLLAMTDIEATLAEYDALIVAIRGHHASLGLLCRHLITGAKTQLPRADQARVIQHFEAVSNCGIEVLAVQADVESYRQRMTSAEDQRARGLDEVFQQLVQRRDELYVTICNSITADT